ncbi:MAG: hypothetical protein WBG48_11425 [Pricia sp.]
MKSNKVLISRSFNLEIGEFSMKRFACSPKGPIVYVFEDKTPTCLGRGIDYPSFR